ASSPKNPVIATSPAYHDHRPQRLLLNSPDTTVAWSPERDSWVCARPAFTDRTRQSEVSVFVPPNTPAFARFIAGRRRNTSCKEVRRWPRYPFHELPNVIYDASLFAPNRWNDRASLTRCCPKHRPLCPRRAA